MKAEQLTEADAEHGEGPAWSPSWGGLRWVDTFDGVLLALAGDGTVTKRRLDRAIGALRPRAGGGMVVALERRFALAGAGDEEPRRLEELWDTPGVQFNDGGCDP
jgi:sugar lactone lactonase YvrE